MSQQEAVKPVVKSSLAYKMAQVLGQVSRVPKNGHNTFQNYAYATEGDVLDAIRPLLAEQGIALFFSCTNYQELENQRTLVTVEITLVDSETGEERTTQCYGEARDADKAKTKQDKGLYKAITGAMKYWMFKTFLISTGDDPEVDNRQSDDSDRPVSKRQPVGKKQLPQSPQRKALQPVASAEKSRFGIIKDNTGFTAEQIKAICQQYSLPAKASELNEEQAFKLRNLLFMMWAVEEGHFESIEHAKPAWGDAMGRLTQEQKRDDDAVWQAWLEEVDKNELEEAS